MDCQDQFKNLWIMYLLGYLNLYIDRCIAQYIDCYSIDSRPTCQSTVDLCLDQCIDRYIILDTIDRYIHRYIGLGPP